MHRSILVAIVAIVVTVLCAVALLVACGENKQRRSVVLITLDTTRPDHLSMYGYARSTTPALDALAQRGIVFEDAWAQAAETGPSLASTLTSRRATITGVRANAEPLTANLPTLATVARDEGYATAAFVSTVLLRANVCAFDRGFDVYDDEMTDPCFGHDNAQRIAERTIDRALAWLEKNDGPYLLWVHLYDPHGPYTPPRHADRLDVSRDSLERRTLTPDRIPRYQRVGATHEAADYVDRYDHEIAYLDDELGRLLGAIDPATTLVAVHADHGEALGEDDYWFRHGSLLHDAALRIPLVIAGPGVEPARAPLPGTMRNLDLVPLLLRLAGLPAIPGAEGIASLPTPTETRVVIAEARRREEIGDRTGVDVRWKLRYRDERVDLLWHPGGKTDARILESAASSASTSSRTDPADAERADAERALGELAAWLEAPELPDPPRITVDVDEALRTLGYR